MRPAEDRFHEECGVCAVVGHPDAANLVYLGLYALQHRGQESAGIATWDGHRVHSHRAMGYVADIFDRKTLDRLPGEVAIGHVRYSTAGDSALTNAQPLVVNTQHGPLAVAHNGNLVNALSLRHALEGEGAIFQSTSDTEVILHLAARFRADSVEEALLAALAAVKGAYSLVVLARERVLAARDPLGFRPLLLGRLGEAWVVASESCAFDLLGAELVREVAPGEVLRLDRAGVRQIRPAASPPYAHCVFEHVYFARPDSRVFGEDVGIVRQRLGERLALEQPADADVVVGVPDSGIPAALGYSRFSGLPFVLGLVRNHYVGRTFIEPKQSIRHFGVKVKLNPVRALVSGKRVVLVDDSIVRGTTSRKIVTMLKQAGAREVHLRISSPPTIGPCFYGIDTPERRELIASSATVEVIRQFVGADSLGYLSEAGMLACLETPAENFCTACFSGRYPLLETESETLAKTQR
ncbi:MAG: amidophosphoribosyltransferase [Acidobacteriota bacterium]|uniref:Amidophosphoribosyltransferase n=1 Tax=Thermoanaerobaculum aquaticum TaxID=1312852 RepID=A0A062XYL5_9BACT|nr:amidophosphoribosyltransferase [Thermoanaerobaculum aquaticum]KDA54524.1 amidophosphoribosyltransferase [Thermoanaerobaculum aquaticum]GBC79863.1 Amidophosphoribosyltransferase [bacterium HR09]